MLRQIRCALSTLAGASIAASSITASAGWFTSSNCGCAPAARPVPVVQQCVQQVAVTEYQQVKQKVRRPVTQVEYIEQPVTTYRPVTETRTVDVPVTTYQNVTEIRNVTKQGGYWQTNYYCNPKTRPCDYDSRPSLIGWLNRTGYRVRSSFTPDKIARRQFVSQTCTQQVPVTRRVALQSVRKQSYQVTKYVPETTTRKVAVNRVKWVEQEVVALKPVTVMKNVPVSRTAWTYVPYGNTAVSFAPAAQLGLAPQPDPVSSAAKPSTTRTARRPVTGSNNDAHDDRGEINRIESDQTPSQQSTAEPADRNLGESSRLRSVPNRAKSMFEPVPARTGRSIGIARVGGWRASLKTAADSPILLPGGSTIASNR